MVVILEVDLHQRAVIIAADQLEGLVAELERAVVRAAVCEGSKASAPLKTRVRLLPQRIGRLRWLSGSRRLLGETSKCLTGNMLNCMNRL